MYLQPNNIMVLLCVSVVKQFLLFLQEIAAFYAIGEHPSSQAGLSLFSKGQDRRQEAKVN